jgi:translation initiation factor eIF-2B subunit epsilon
MTLVLKEVGNNNASESSVSSSSSTNSAAKIIRPTGGDLCIGLDPTSENRVLLYDNHAQTSQLQLPCSFFKSHSQMEVRTDLIDTGVGICSPDVLGRFEDEFDYLDISQDFVSNCVAEEEEGLQTRIHAHILPKSQYAARVVDFATYHGVSQDLLRRWCYPIVPDNNLHTNSGRAGAGGAGHNVLYKVQANYHYKESLQPSKVARSSTIQGPGMMGSHCQIADNSVIQSSILGHSVQIAEQVTVQESHIWDNVTIERGATVVQSIVAQDCIIRQGAVVSKGCVLGKGCIIGANVILPEFTRITLCKEEEDPFGDDGGFGDFEDVDDKMDDDEEEKDTPSSLLDETDHAVVGPDGKGHVWRPPLDEDTDDEDDELLPEDEYVDPIALQSIGFDVGSYYQKRRARQEAQDDNDWRDNKDQDEEEERMETEAFKAYTEGAFTFEDTGTAPNMTATSPAVVVGRTPGVNVVKQLQDICLEFEETSPMENLAIELNSYKFSQNASYADCTMAAILAILEKMQITEDTSDGKLVGTLKARLEFWAPLLQKLSIGQEEEKAVIHGLERAATAEGQVGEKLSSGLSFRLLLQTLHDEEVLGKEAILAWAEERKGEAADSPLGKLFRLQSIQDFLEWLEEEEEEEDSGEEGSDEENEDSD